MCEQVVLLLLKTAKQRFDIPETQNHASSENIPTLVNT
jgi:hypothetical protein